MADSVHDILVRVRERLSDPERWTKYTLARRPFYEDLVPCSVGDSGATCWCLAGAVMAETMATSSAVAINAIHECLPAYLQKRNGGIVEFNDGARRKHADILRVLDCAIAKAADHD